jgi:hypothetical protein
MNRLDEACGGPPRSQSAEIMPQRGDCALHAALEVGEIECGNSHG